jgi:sterol desaturase/sphingolipid hydroxylase (fatty acid hydroxylase superfamily)
MGAKMLAKKFINWLPYLILPGAGIALGVLYLTMRGSALAKTFPFYGSFVSLFIMITLERVWTWRHAKSQRHMIWRDLTSTMVQTFLIGGIFGAIFLPILHWGPQTFLGRRLLFGLSDQLGPLWVQVIAVFLLSTLWGYGMHRFEHYNSFLWKLHGYHHSVTNVQATNILVSNPVDYALRNVLGGLILSIVGFNPIAIVIAGVIDLNYGSFSHSGTDAKGGWMNYIFNGPEVHRWHHSVKLPDDPRFRYGCNFGVATTFWDQLFGTFCLPKDANGEVLAPPALGHPEGYPDEPNYLKMLFAVRAFPALERLFEKKQQPISVPAE